MAERHVLNFDIRATDISDRTVPLTGVWVHLGAIGPRGGKPRGRFLQNPVMLREGYAVAAFWTSQPGPFRFMGSAILADDRTPVAALDIG